MGKINQDKLNLINSLKPFIGQRAGGHIEAVQAMLAVLDTEPATRASVAVKSLLAKPAVEAKPEGGVKETLQALPLARLGSAKGGGQTGWVLFLVLFLILAGQG